MAGSSLAWPMFRSARPRTLDEAALFSTSMDEAGQTLIALTVWVPQRAELTSPRESPVLPRASLPPSSSSPSSSPTMLALSTSALPLMTSTSTLSSSSASSSSSTSTTGTSTSPNNFGNLVSPRARQSMGGGEMMALMSPSLSPRRSYYNHSSSSAGGVGGVGGVGGSTKALPPKQVAHHMQVPSTFTVDKLYTPLSVEFHRLGDLVPILEMHRNGQTIELRLLPINRVLRQRILSVTENGEFISSSAPPPIVKKKKSLDHLRPLPSKRQQPLDDVSTDSDHLKATKDDLVEKAGGKKKGKRWSDGGLELGARVKELEKQLQEEKERTAEAGRRLEKARAEWESEKAHLQKLLAGRVLDERRRSNQLTQSMPVDLINAVEPEVTKAERDKLKQKRKKVKAQRKALMQREAELDEREKGLASLEQEMENFIGYTRLEQQRKLKEEEERQQWEQRMRQREVELADWERRLQKKERKRASFKRVSRKLAKKDQEDVINTNGTKSPPRTSQSGNKVITAKVSFPVVASREDMRLEEVALLDAGTESMTEDEDPHVVEAIKQQKERWMLERHGSTRTARWEEMLKEQSMTLHELARAKSQLGAHSMIQLPIRDGGKAKTPRGARSVGNAMMSELGDSEPVEMNQDGAQTNRNAGLGHKSEQKEEEEDKSELEADEEDIVGEKSDTEPDTKGEPGVERLIQSEDSPTRVRRQTMPVSKSKTWEEKKSSYPRTLSAVAADYQQKKKEMQARGHLRRQDKVSKSTTDLLNVSDKSNALVNTSPASISLNDKTVSPIRTSANATRSASDNVPESPKRRHNLGVRKSKVPFRVQTLQNHRPKSFGVGNIYAELRFPKNATILVTDVDEENAMYYGEHAGESGWFPADLVKVIDVAFEVEEWEKSGSHRRRAFSAESVEERDLGAALAQEAVATSSDDKKEKEKEKDKDKERGKKKKKSGEKKKQKSNDGEKKGSRASWGKKKKDKAG